MKKLLIIMLVLCFTSLASATNIWLTDAGATINATPGTVTLTISSDGATALGLISANAIITVTGGDVITAALDIPQMSAYGWDPTLSGPAIGVPGASVEIGGGSGNFTTGNIAAIIGFVDVAYTGGTQVVDIGPGMTYGGSYDVMGGSPVFDPGVVTIIPEPMTIALLGLGGLFMLRRRK